MRSSQKCCVHYVVTMIVIMEIIPKEVYFMREGVTVQGNCVPENRPVCLRGRQEQKFPPVFYHYKQSLHETIN